MGFHSISIDSGWVVALISLLVVILGLAMRARFLVAPRKMPDPPDQSPLSEEQHLIEAEPAGVGYDINLLDDLSSAAAFCKSLSAAIGEPFKLAVLYHQLAKSSWPHPHLTIRSLREAELLKPAGNGLFAWSKS
jgi:hypothetical protein